MGPVDEVIDAEGLLILPGVVDPHVHFNDAFMGTVSVHDFYTGTRAAAYGGVTSIIDFSNQIPGHSLRRTLEAKREEAEGKALVDWGVHPVITRATPDTLSEIPLLVGAGAPTIKCYMTYRSEGLMMEEPDLKNILARLKDSGGILLVHAEDNALIETNVPSLISAGNTAPIFHARSRPPETEDRAIRRIIRIARETGGRVFVVHLASARGLGHIRRARSEGVDIYCETCTHYLVFTESVLEREDGIKWICSPPLRTKPIQDHLWAGLAAGDIALVSSDDAAYSWQAKLMGKDRFDLCPNGIPGIEVRLPLLYTLGVSQGRISLIRMVELVSTEPARHFGLFPKKGIIRPGSDADLVLFDPHERWIMGRETLHMAADWSAYQGIEIIGRILRVLSRGELIIDHGTCLAEAGRGRYLHRKIEA
jgi:dihydropyrimidinase